MPPAAKSAPPPTDGFLHEGVPAQKFGHATKCGAAMPTSTVFPRAAFLRQARRRDPEAESKKRIPPGVCVVCWQGPGLVLRAPKTGKGSVEALIRAAKKDAVRK